MTIKKFREFNESISGTELIGPVGPGYGETGLQNKTITGHDTAMILSDIDGRFYNIDDFNELYNHFLSVVSHSEEWNAYMEKGGKPVTNDFTKENIDTILRYKF